MNKQGPNGIGWCDFTWSPLVGCLHGCSYCYARRIAERFKGTGAFPNGFAPTWHPERLGEPLRVKRPSRIFASSMCDPFGDWVQVTWLDQMLHSMRCAPQHRFLVLTKQPQNMPQHLYRQSARVWGRALGQQETLSNIWLGCTITGAKGEQDPSPYMLELKETGWHVFVSIEPLLGPVNPDWYFWAEWVILGALTGKGATKPIEEQVMDVLCFTTHVPLFVKKNMAHYYPELCEAQAYPSGLKVHDNEL